MRKCLGYFTSVANILFPKPSEITTGEDEKGIYVMNNKTGKKKYVPFQKSSEYRGEEKGSCENNNQSEKC